jgi:hypothetical protein
MRLTVGGRDMVVFCFGQNMSSAEPLHSIADSTSNACSPGMHDISLELVVLALDGNIVPD